MFALAAAASGGAGASAADTSKRFEMYSPIKDVSLDIGELGTGDFSIAMFLWNPFTAGPVAGILAAKERTCVATNQFRIEIHEDCHIAVFGLGLEAGGPGMLTSWPHRSRDASGWASILTSHEKAPRGMLTHVAFTRDGPTCSLYINGELDVAALCKPVGKHVNGERLRIGSRLPAAGSAGVDWYRGDIAGAQFFPRALEAEEIEELNDGEDPRFCLPAQFPFRPSCLARPSYPQAALFLTCTR